MNAWNTLNDPIGVSGVNTLDPNGDSPVSFRLPSMDSNDVYGASDSLTVTAEGVSLIQKVLLLLVHLLLVILIFQC